MITGLQQQQPWRLGAAVRSAPMPQHGGNFDQILAGEPRSAIPGEGLRPPGDLSDKARARPLEDR